ncbi:hypothetical protein MHYP_G00284780 [Metynnis hypsauchen]
MAHNPQAATAEIQVFCDLVKPQVEQKIGKKFQVFKARSFKTQAMTYINYFIKVHVGGNDYIHLKVFKPLLHDDHEVELKGIQTAKKFDETITYF